MKRRSRSRGYAVVWILVTLALITAAICSIEFTVDHRPWNPTVLSVFAISMVITALGLVIEVRRDLYAALPFLLFLSAVTTIIAGCVAVYGEKPHPIAAVLAVLTGAVAIVCGVLLAKNQLGRDALPNVLGEMTTGPIYEVDGVQLAALQSKAELNVGEQLEILVLAQNCWDTERTLIFGLAPKSGKQGLIYDRRAKLTLGAAEAGVLRIPVLAAIGAVGRFSLLAEPRVEGRGGARVRKRRAPQFPTRVPAWFTVLALGAGHFYWGGGMAFELTIHEGRLPDEMPMPSEPRTEIVWRPNGDDGQTDRIDAAQAP